jgi:hypothetical protein
LFVSLGLSLLLVLAAPAQQPPAKGCCPYDPSTVKTLKGTVVEFKTVSCPQSAAGGGVHLVVKSGTETIEVRLGPKEYWDKKGFEVQTGDEIEVTGARLTGVDPPALVAREIRKGEDRIGLRQLDGTPLWSCCGGHHHHGGHGGCAAGGCCRRGGSR